MKVVCVDVRGRQIRGELNVHVEGLGHEAIRITAQPPGYRPVAKIVFRPPPEQVILPCPIDPEHAHGPELIEATAYNLMAKIQATYVAGNWMWPWFREPVERARDRIYYEVAPRLHELVSHTGVFSPVPGALHEPHEEGFEAVASYKTHDAHGNLQLSFFRRDDEWVVDADIDEAAGLEHVFEVLRNHLAGHKTHPYDVHQILVWYQGIDPGYELTVA